MALEEVTDTAKRPTDMRLLVAFEDEYRAYRSAISSAIEALRPRVQIETTGTDILDEELARFAPQAVICSRPEGTDTKGRIAWVELPPEPDQTACTRLGERRYEMDNPSLESMLELVDEAVRLLKTNARTPLR